MVNYKRFLSTVLKKDLKKKNKIIILYGARQVGKTTLVKKVMATSNYKSLYINADELKYIDILSSRDSDKIKGLIEGYELVVIDEAQRIPDIGINLKIIKDSIPEVKLIVTGSSSFELTNIISEPLTGRSLNYILYPLSLLELSEVYNSFELNNKIEELLIFGTYPEVMTTVNHSDKQKLLEQIGIAYLYKDILELMDIKYHHKLRDLLKLLAFQIGSEVSLHELSNALRIGRETIDRYLNLLEKSFVIFRLGGYSKNLRKEVTKSNKFYFYDLGIRNLLIDNFNTLKNRNDAGMLWENFVINERIKALNYKGIRFTPYFWRLYTGAEIDYIEERKNKLWGYEIKYSRKTVKPPESWLSTYPDAEFKIINPENYLKILLDD